MECKARKKGRMEVCVESSDDYGAFSVFVAFSILSARPALRSIPKCLFCFPLPLPIFLVTHHQIYSNPRKEKSPTNQSVSPHLLHPHLLDSLPRRISRPSLHHIHSTHTHTHTHQIVVVRHIPMSQHEFFVCCCAGMMGQILCANATPRHFY